MAVSGTGVALSNVVVVNSTTITATFTIAANATLGAGNVTVTTPAGTSGAQTFTVNAPPSPTLTGLSAASGHQGTSVNETLTGTNFLAGATVAVSGTGVAVSNVVVVNSTTMTATFTIASNAGLGTDSVSVTTPAGTSGTLPFTVNSSSSTPPTVSITAPADGATVSGSAVQITANASSSVGIAGVQFMLDGANLGAQVLAAPYSINWDTSAVSNGSTHVLAAVAIDTNNNQTTSAPITVTVSNAALAPTLVYNLPVNGGLSLITADTSSPLIGVSHALVQQDSFSTSSGASVSNATADNAPKSVANLSAPASSFTGVSMIGLRTNGVLVTEGGVPASPAVPSGRIYAEVHNTVNTGLALSNSSGLDATISYYFTDAAGTDFGSGSFRLLAYHQIAAFLNQAPFNLSVDLQGTFTFTSTVPVGALALRGIFNERSEFVFTTLPVIPLGAT